MPPKHKPTEAVSEFVIRQAFNQRRLAEKAVSGELITILKRNSHLEPPPATEPYCTHSQIVYYYTSDWQPLAIVHQYRRPDGSLGASGKPDPKRLVIEDRILIVKQVR